MVARTRGGGGGNDRPTDRCGELPRLKLVTDGNGNVRPLGNTTDNSAIRTQQGFQAIKERFKLLDSARKYLMDNVLNIVSITVSIKMMV